MKLIYQGRMEKGWSISIDGKQIEFERGKLFEVDDKTAASLLEQQEAGKPLFVTADETKGAK